MSKDVYEENKRLKARIAELEAHPQSEYAREREHQKQVENLLVSSVEAFFKGQAVLEINPNGIGYRVRFVGPGYDPKAL